MTNRMLTLLGAMVLSVSALAQKPIVPADLAFAPGDLSVKQISDSTFEITRLVPSDPSVGSAINFSTFCVASYLARERGYSGWALGTRQTKEQHPKEMHYVVTLLNGADGVPTLSPDLKWTAYTPYKKTRAACVSFLGPKYLWPDEQ